MSQRVPVRGVTVRLVAALALVTVLAASVVASVAWAATPAGTFIRNQASASYLDINGRRITVTSNIVETLVEQVGGFTLQEDVARRAAPGTTVQLPHRVVNTGNGDDRFALSASNIGGDNIDLASIEIYADVNRDGIADSGSPITVSPALVAGGSFDFVVQAVVPSSATDGSIARIEVTASSDFAQALVEVDTDTVTVGSGGAITVSKSISSLAGASPSGPWRVSLNYANTGTDAVGDLVLLDALPAGMSYVAGSGSWSGSPTVPSDANPSDVHAGAGSNLVWCAYDPSCVGLPEASLDADSDSSNQVTAVIDFVSAGSSGSVSFDVVIDSGLDPATIANQAEYEYDVAIGTVPRELSNSVAFTVLPSHGVIANGSTTSAINFLAEPISIQSASAGSSIQYANIVWNTGNATDTFTIEVDSISSTFPAGTLWRLLRADGATPMLDTNSDGYVDTGPIPPGAFTTVVLELTLPVDAVGDNNGLGFDIEITARSVSDASVFDTIVDHLDSIVPAAVDLTNQAPAGAPGALGVGMGPEQNPVSTVGIDANGEARFDLYIAHSGELPTRYELSASTNAGGTGLPAGWQVRFEDPNNGEAAWTTEPLVTGTPAHIIAIVTPPADALAATQSIFFTARSRDGNVSDEKHDAVIVDAISDLRLEPELSAQLEPGGTTVYTHRVTNDGNAPISDVRLTVSNSLADWSTVLWEDTNGDGAQGPGDVQLSGAFTLNPGESRVFFARVHAPATAAMGTENLSTITALWDADSESIAIVDRSRVTQTHVSILKTQAVDMGCDGAPDTGQSFETTPIEIAPGNNCVIYRLVATNTGNETSYNVAIRDYTPTWTVYETGASCSRNPCWMVMPSPGSEGTLSATTDQLAPGESYYLEFAVRVL